MLEGKKILLGISGGIAAYKCPELIRQLTAQGAEVKAVATKNALQFVTPVALQTVSRNKVYFEVFEPVGNFNPEHISHADWGDCMVVAPATANIIGKFAGGIADDALSTLFLALNKPVFIAPAMNDKMYAHPIVMRNMQQLKNIGVQFIEPAYGELACGATGKGRMEEPENIVRFIDNFFAEKLLAGKKILITAGPTYEKIDPVRFIGNFSSGKMGFALAESCARHGAEVILVAGQVDLQTLNPAIRRIDVTSAKEMYDVVCNEFTNVDGAILCAAVADFTPEKVSDRKIKRGHDNLTLQLFPTRDIAQALGKQKKENQVVVGFALETDRGLENARQKLEKKNFDFIVLNSLNDKNAGFAYSTNKISIIHQNGETIDFQLKPKTEVAEDIVLAMTDVFRSKNISTKN
ncbi:MAG: bifunctional phosphopantothenoylcysteine decarboxylase/phosphopantothenate--cysteine ligase CoaBC [Prevotellaceae bacterium]|jgi:phosphopantothenoylcysteine decarboxylase/phosphopantothenate--cysteine ligase|nr:bifunctional phosphopantothenoylcysteine decarboxylase/phosphopantothenate--cysteine ligase CoaBC [Prevotellaceae bacterium]